MAKQPNPAVPVERTGAGRSFPDVVAGATQLGVGGAGGFLAAKGLKHFGPYAAAGLGVGFVFLQAMEYSGYVHVDWRRVERDYIRLMDVDHDGVVTQRDASLATDRLADVFVFNLPAACGFTGGWIAGAGGPATVSGGAAAAGVTYALASRIVVPQTLLIFSSTSLGSWAIIQARQWWGAAKATVEAVERKVAPEEQFRRAILDYDYRQLQRLSQQIATDRKALSAGAPPADVGVLDMKDRVVQQRMAEVPQPKKPWWKVW